MTGRQKEIYDVLRDDEFLSAGIIARLAGLETRNRAETAARYCIQLMRLGLAVRGGNRTYPTWKRANTSSERFI